MFKNAKLFGTTFLLFLIGNVRAVGSHSIHQKSVSKKYDQRSYCTYGKKSNW